MDAWFTKEEKKAIVFIFLSLLVGMVVSRYFKFHPLRKEVPLSQAEKVIFSHPQININSADFSQLLTIPGIGPALAEAILEYRKRRGPFKNKEQLLEIKGIGKNKLREIIPYIAIE